MVKVCCVKNCSSESYAHCGISFHSFPKDEIMRSKWLDALGGKIKSKQPVVCSRHFKTEHFRPTVLPTLTKDAIPHISPAVKKEAEAGDITIQVSQQSVDPRPSTSQENFDDDKRLNRAQLDNIDVGTQTISLPSTKEEILQKKLKCLRRKLMRQNIKIHNMKNLLKVLKKKKA